MALHNAVFEVGYNRYNHFYAGEPGNCWNNEMTGTGGFSRAVKLYGMPFLSIMGEIEADTDLSFWTSPDDGHYYYCGTITNLINPASPPESAWGTGISYPAGAIVTDGGSKYECILAHTSNTGRRPPNTTYWRVWAGLFPQTFHIYPTVGAEYVKMRSSKNVRATITITAKRSF